MTSGIKVGMFGPGYADLENQNYIEGNLIQIVDKVVDLLEQMYLIHPIHYEGMQRVEPLEFPIEALREILYNAVAHKDYRGTEITVRVFKDRLEIWNPGTIPSELDINHLWERHGSIQRNRLIAEALQGCWNEYVMTIPQGGRSSLDYNSPGTMSVMRFVSDQVQNPVLRIVIANK